MSENSIDLKNFTKIINKESREKFYIAFKVKTIDGMYLYCIQPPNIYLTEEEILSDYLVLDNKSNEDDEEYEEN